MKNNKCCFAVPPKPVPMDAPPSSTSAVTPTRKATVPSICQRCVLPAPVMAVLSIYCGWRSMVVPHVRLRTTKRLGSSVTRMGSRRFIMCGKSQSKWGHQLKAGFKSDILKGIDFKVSTQGKAWEALICCRKLWHWWASRQSQKVWRQLLQRPASNLSPG